MKNIRLFFWAILIQVFILNNIQLSGYINPYYYIVFILYFPTKSSKNATLLLSFLLGIVMDFFCNSYGTHAFASVLIAYLKILWINKVNHAAESEDSFELRNLSLSKFMPIAIYFIIIHHFTLFYLEIFSFSGLLNVLSTTLVSSIFTFILLIMHKIISAHKK